MDMATILQWCGALVVIGGGVGVLWAGGKWMFGTLRKVNDFLEDWRGEDARPGYPGRPGVLQRLVDLEDKVRVIEHEAVPNSGSSMKDQLNRIDAAVRSVPELASRLAALETRVPSLPAQDGTQA